MTDRELQALPDSVAKGKFDKPLDEYSWKTTSAPSRDQAGRLRRSHHRRLADGLVRRADVPVPDAAVRDAPMTRRAQARAGMTLMELVIGLAITGMMAAAGAARVRVDHRPPPRDSRRVGRRPSARRRCAR